MKYCTLVFFFFFKGGEVQISMVCRKKFLLAQQVETMILRKDCKTDP